MHHLSFGFADQRNMQESSRSSKSMEKRGECALSNFGSLTIPQTVLLCHCFCYWVGINMSDAMIALLRTKLVIALCIGSMQQCHTRQGKEEFLPYLGIRWLTKSLHDSEEMFTRLKRIRKPQERKRSCLLPSSSRRLPLQYNIPYGDWLFIPSLYMLTHRNPLSAWLLSWSSLSTVLFSRALLPWYQRTFRRETYCTG